MKQDLQIKKWMLEGLSDREIEAKLKVIKGKEEDDFQVHMKEVMDEPAAVAGPVSDTVQGMFDRTVAAIDKSIIVKDITGLTKQGELFDAVEAGGIYKITVSNQVQLVFCPTKTTTQAFIKAFVTKQDAIEVITQTATKGSTSNFNWLVSTMIVGTPTHDNHAATKHYVDNKVSAIEYDTKLYSFTAASHVFRPDTGWEFIAITQVEVTYDVNYKYVASDVGATSTSGEFEFHGATPKEGAFTYNFDKAAQTITIAQSANFNGLATGGNIRMLVRKVV